MPKSRKCGTIKAISKNGLVIYLKVFSALGAVITDQSVVRATTPNARKNVIFDDVWIVKER